MSGIGMLSVVPSRALPVNIVGLAGYAYMLVGLVESYNGTMQGRVRRLADEDRVPETS